MSTRVSELFLLLLFRLRLVFWLRESLIWPLAINMDRPPHLPDDLKSPEKYMSSVLNNISHHIVTFLLFII